MIKGQRRSKLLAGFKHKHVLIKIRLFPCNWSVQEVCFCKQKIEPVLNEEHLSMVKHLVNNDNSFELLRACDIPKELSSKKYDQKVHKTQTRNLLDKILRAGNWKNESTVEKETYHKCC